MINQQSNRPVGSKPTSAQSVWRSQQGQFLQAVEPGRTDDEYVVGNLAHADEPRLALIRGDEMKMCQLGNGMSHRLVDGAGPFAAMNMDNRNIQMNRSQRLPPASRRGRRARRTMSG